MGFYCCKHGVEDFYDGAIFRPNLFANLALNHQLQNCDFKENNERKANIRNVYSKISQMKGVSSCN